jgi:pantoate--beta-alanine ligase
MMRIVETPAEMQCRAEAVRRRGKRIAFVPTMGFLHEGHLSLMHEGRRRAEVLVASIFVNPTQFAPGEDFARYPRSFERDCELLQTVPVDMVFAPSAETMYPRGAQTWVETTEITQGLCGAHRPGHFRGVTTVVAKLFNIVKPHVALFGEKDFQQLRAIQRMVKDLDFGIEIVPMPTVRDSDGLAMSSRNAYLTAEERTRALSLSRALAAAHDSFVGGVRDPRMLACAATAVLAATPGLRIEYVEAVDAETLAAVDRVERPVVVAIAAHVGKTRLIDNAVLPAPPA